MSVLVFLCAFPCSAGRVEELKETLLGPGQGYDHLLQVPKEDVQLQAIQELGTIGSREAVDALFAFLTAPTASHKHKQHAVVALGTIGTEGAIEAIGKFEQWAEARRKTTMPLHLEKQDHALSHFSAYTLEPITTCPDSAGNEWALVSWPRYARYDLWLVQVKDNEAVKPPVLLDLPVGSNPMALGEMIRSNAVRLTPGKQPDSFVVDLAGDKFPFTLSEVMKDGDNDGLSDIQEGRMLTDPTNPDTDGDGEKDGDDPAPLAPKNPSPDDDAQIRQAVFTLYFATTDSRNALLMVGDFPFANQEYYGYLGPVFKIPEIVQGFNNITAIAAERTSADEATAKLSDYSGPLAASGNTITLRKLHGRWVVTDFRMDWIS